MGIFKNQLYNIYTFIAIFCAVFAFRVLYEIFVMLPDFDFLLIGTCIFFIILTLLLAFKIKKMQKLSK